MRPLLLLTAFVVIVPACAPARRAVPAPQPTGPPEVRAEVVLAHARQLDQEVGARPPGSPEEQAAGVYVTAHLQQAGYVVFLDGVPVADLVRSTNVIAGPPSGDAPQVVVVTSYSSPPDAARGGGAVGLLLETARALRVAAPEHPVQFAATGADHAPHGGSLRGVRRLAEKLREDGPGALVVVLGDVDDDPPCVVATGGLVPAVPATATVCSDVAERDPVAAAAARLFGRAGFDTARLGGALDAAAEALMRFLSNR